MCGRYAAAKDQAALVEEFEVDAVIDAPPAPNFNVAPTTNVAMIVDRPVEADHPKPATASEHGRPAGGDPPAQDLERQLRQARWGLVPSWAKSLSIGSRMINARWEDAAGKPAFRTALARRRCLVPADGYYEWLAMTPDAPERIQRAADTPDLAAAGTGAAKGAGSGGAAAGRGTAATRRPPKQPFFIHDPTGASLALAGIYEFWRPDPESPWVVSLAILTTDSEGPAAQIHDRMPVIVDPHHLRLWLRPGPPPELAAFRMSPDALATRRVSTEVNKVSNNGAHLLEPV